MKQDATRGQGLSSLRPALAVLATTALLALAGCNSDGEPRSIVPPAETSGDSTGSHGSEAPSSRNVTLSWQAPDERADGTPLRGLKGFHIWIGRTSDGIERAVELHAGLSTYVVEDLAPGTWYFAMSAVDRRGVESALSDVVSARVN